MKQNAVGLANICIMSTIVLVLISATASLYIGQENIMNTRFKTEFPQHLMKQLRKYTSDGADRAGRDAKPGLEIIHEQKYRYVPLSA